MIIYELNKTINEFNNCLIIWSEIMFVVRIWEGLGNQMFQYAYARNLQKKTGSKVYLEGRRIYRKALTGEDLIIERKCELINFNLKLKFINPKYLSKWNYLEQRTFYQKIRYSFAINGIGDYGIITDQKDQCAYHQELMDIHRNMYIMGHFLNKKYFESIKEELLEDFSLKNNIILPETIRERFKAFDTVSIHIRRGDYLYVEHAQRINREMKSGHYYERAITYIAKKIKNPCFLFFSDDIAWVKENIFCPYEHIYISDRGFKDYEEMMLMSYCDHNIIAHSTFSYWGAWLNQNKEKIVIYPKHWLPSIIPDGWIRM